MCDFLEQQYKIFRKTGENFYSNLSTFESVHYQDFFNGYMKKFQEKRQLAVLEPRQCIRNLSFFNSSVVYQKSDHCSASVSVAYRG